MHSPTLTGSWSYSFGLVSQQRADPERGEVSLRRCQEVPLVGRAGRGHGGPAANELLGNE
jgi:hypothetical protein